MQKALTMIFHKATQSQHWDSNSQNGKSNEAIFEYL